jgi:hypothetical protein
LRDVERLLGAQGKGLWSDAAITSLERALAEIGRILDKKVKTQNINTIIDLSLTLVYFF